MTLVEWKELINLIFINSAILVFWIAAAVWFIKR
jgi:hypothetical protein